MIFDYIIMCGGEGIRLKPFTYIIPKPFLTMNNISSFDYILKNINLNKNVNSLVNKIQKNFLRKYKNEYKYIKIK